jgi:hypothetical protein
MRALTAPASLNAIVNEPFTGHDRATAKTVVVKGPAKTYKDLKALLKALPSDQAMLHHSPSITKNSPRVREENQNVKVLACWIYAVKHEADNDFHVILGSSNSAASSVFLNAEICGIPKASPSVNELKKVRQAFVSLIGLNHAEQAYKGFVKLGAPLLVIVEGSLFYDVDHPPGAVGPAGLKPKTSWEIHPITAI